MHIGENMVKVISLSEEAYRELKKLKNGDSFSEAILRVLKEKKKGTDYEGFRKLAGALRGSRSDWEKIKEEIYKHRKIRMRRWQF